MKYERTALSLKKGRRISTNKYIQFNKVTVFYFSRKKFAGSYPFRLSGKSFAKKPHKTFCLLPRHLHLTRKPEQRSGSSTLCLQTKSVSSHFDGNEKFSIRRERIGKLVFKYRQSIVAVCSTLFAVFRPRIARADSIFSAAQNAMKCIITSAGAGGGATNALLQNLPVILFTSLQLVIFGYFIYTVVQSVSAYGRGEEVTHVVQQPLFTFVFIIIIFVKND